MKLRAETSLYHWTTGMTNRAPARPPSSSAEGGMPDKISEGHHHIMGVPGEEKSIPGRELRLYNDEQPVSEGVCLPSYL